jgi:diguanylate cyclase (GGDEF)-like protein
MVGGDRSMRRLTVRSVLVLLSLLACVAAAVVVIGRLESAATGTRDAQSALLAIRVDLMQLRDIPWDAAPDSGTTPAEARGELQDAIGRVRAAFGKLQRHPGLPEDARILDHFDQSTKALWTLLAAVQTENSDATNAAADVAARQMYAADTAMTQAAKEYRARSADALTKAQLGSVAVILLLFAAFGWFYVRAVRRRRSAEVLAAENRNLLEASREEALTDGLTRLGNRRSLVADLEAASRKHERHVLALFDLDGFKHYNDSFGHPAGDELLARLGQRLRTTLAGIGTPYRIGGDEFCVLAAIDDGGSASVAPLAAAALSEAGEGFTIGCSYGTALMPTDTTDPSQALLLADQRMYEQKRSGRASASRQSANVLLQLLAERSRDLGRHTADVARLAEMTAGRFGLDSAERARIRLAAELHDVGKAAIPDSILNKPGALDEEEWKFVRRHTVIGQRIVAAAPSLAHAADLVRWHHERYDGTGYPDHLEREDIPFGARIIAVSDAYDAMTSDRPYRGAISPGEAVAELKQGAGTQFDPTVVEVFLATLAESRTERRVAASRRETRAA